MGLEEKIIKKIDEKRERIFEIYDFLYKHPEISLQEFESSRFLAQFLREEGFEVTEHLEGMETAFKAVKKSGTGKGPRIAYLAEYDALPGVGHACGHHMIASMSVGAAIGLSVILPEVEGEVTVFGTPAEETGHGKSYLVDHGAFDGYDAAMMIHPDSLTEIYPEELAIGGIDFTFEGVATHAAMAYTGVNALDALILFYNNFSVLRQQLKDGAKIHGIILDGGKAANIVPDHTVIRLEFRFAEMDYLSEIFEKVIDCAKAAALATGCTMSYEHFEPTCENMVDNFTIGETFRKHMEPMGYINVPPEESPRGGSSDIGNLSHVLPTMHAVLKVCEQPYGLHTAEFREATLLPYAKDALIDGVKLLALTGYDLMTEPGLIEEAWKEFRQKIK